MTAKDNILKIHQVTQITGLTRDEINQKINDGTFPKPFKLNRKTIWLKSQVDEWLQNQNNQTFNTRIEKILQNLKTILLITDVLLRMEDFISSKLK